MAASIRNHLWKLSLSLYIYIEHIGKVFCLINIFSFLVSSAGLHLAQEGIEGHAFPDSSVRDVQIKAESAATTAACTEPRTTQA